MATTKKSTKATSKPSSKRTTKTAGAQATRSNKKPQTAKLIKGASTNRVTSKPTLNPLRRLLIISAGLYVILAVAAGLLMNTRAYELFVSFLARDELASQTNTIFASAVHVVYNIELRWAVVGLMAIAAVLSLLLATRWRSRLWRWIDTAIVSALMVEVIALLSGAQDIVTLKLIGGLTALGCLLAWVAEKEHAENGRRSRAAFWFSLIAGLLPWLAIAVMATSTYVYGMVRYSWFVYALYATTLAAALACAISLRRRLLTSGPDERSARNLAMINLLSRAAFAIILIIGLKK